MYLLNLFKKNIQLNQTIILSSVLLVWVEFYDLYITYLEIFTIFWTVITLDLLFNRYFKNKWLFPFSWVNAWFWISFFLRSEDLVLYILAWILAIWWKYIFLAKWKHFFNPSNMGVFIVLMLFPHYAWVNPLQWGQSVELFNYIIIIFTIFILGFFILHRLKNILNYKFYDLVWWFIIAHLFIYFLFTKETSLNSFYLFFNGSFFIFLFFMLTDPKTNPLKSSVRFLYWICVGTLFYILQFFINENYSLLGSLFVMTLFLPIIWKYENKTINIKNIKINKSILILLILLSISLLYICVQVYLYWKIDLLFDNRCNQLFCK